MYCYLIGWLFWKYDTEQIVTISLKEGRVFGPKRTQMGQNDKALKDFRRESIIKLKHILLLSVSLKSLTVAARELSCLHWRSGLVSSIIKYKALRGRRFQYRPLLHMLCIYLYSLCVNDLGRQVTIWRNNEFR